MLLGYVLLVVKLFFNLDFAALQLLQRNVVKILHLEWLTSILLRAHFAVFDAFLLEVYPFGCIFSRSSHRKRLESATIII